MKSILVYVYDGCDGNPCSANDCPHNLVAVVLVSSGMEFAEIIEDNQENIMQSITNLAKELFYAKFTDKCFTFDTK